MKVGGVEKKDKERVECDEEMYRGIKRKMKNIIKWRMKIRSHISS